MKFKTLLFTILFFACSVSIFAKPVIDSVGVKNNNGKKVVLFKVKAKDTYYSIGHRYNVKAEVLMKFNNSKKQTLTIGSIVRVPTDLPYKKTEKIVKETKKEKKERLAREAREAKKQRNAAANSANIDPEQPVVQPVVQTVQQPLQENTSPPIQYKVSAGETLYAISKRFNTSIDAIMKLNSLTSDTLTPGELLLVNSGQSSPQPSARVAVFHKDSLVAKKDSAKVAPVISIVKDSSAAERKFNANRYGIYEKNEKGVATWIDDTSLDPNKKLVLHRTAPIGTVIKITNPMTNRTTFAKVVGRFTDNESTKDVIIVMTKNVADSLGALDKRFYVNISYGSPNE